MLEWDVFGILAISFVIAHGQQLEFDLFRCFRPGRCCSRSENGGETGMKVGEATAAAMEMFFGIWDFWG